MTIGELQRALAAYDQGVEVKIEGCDCAQLLGGVHFQDTDPPRVILYRAFDGSYGNTFPRQERDL